jgi:hypothetical protein
MDEPLTAEMEAGLKAVLLDNLEYPFEIRVRRRERIERGAGDKYEDFLSLI